MSLVIYEMKGAYNLGVFLGLRSVRTEHGLGLVHRHSRPLDHLEVLETRYDLSFNPALSVTSIPQYNDGSGY